MTTRVWWTLPCVGLIALAGGCAGRGAAGGTSQSPAARQVETSQERSAKALDDASESQKKAADQAEKAAEAQEQVQQAQVELQEAQKRLNEAQAKAEKEQQKAQQLQQEANRTTQSATREAQQSQQQATQTLSQQGEQVARGEQTLSGFVSQANGTELVVKSQAGEEMRFKVTDQTQIRIDGRQGSASEILPGADARVAYQVGEMEPTAMRVEVITGATPQRSGTGSSGTGSSEPTTPSTGSTPDTTTPPPQDTPQPPPTPESGSTIRP
jgi:DNA polymerase III gamma/tau subunit